MTTTKNILVCALLLVPLAARAADPKKDDEPADKPAPAAEGSPQAVRATSFLLGHGGVADQTALAVMRALDDGLKRNSRLEMKDLDTRLADFAQEIPQDDIEQGRTLLKEGQTALHALELPVAVKKLNQAIDTLSKVLPHIKKQELAEAMMSLAAAQFEQGDKRSARATLLRLLVWRSDYRLDTNKYPPALIQPLEDARHELEKLKRGSIEIRSEPAAAQAYVDGKYVGVTPTFGEGLAAGDHYVTLKREGFKKAVAVATVSAKVQQVLTIPLEKSSKYLLVEQALNSVERTIGGDMIDAAADTLKEVLFVDHAVFVRLSTPQQNALKVEAWLYDLRIRKRLNAVNKTVPAHDAEKQLQGLASTLYENVDYEAELEAPKDAPPPKRQERLPVYKQWWLWTVVGVAAAGLAIGVGVGVAYAPKGCGGITLGNCAGFSFP
jgi:hypothetical protein